MKFLNRLLLFSCVGALCLMMSCDDDPEAENVNEVITDVILTFVPEGDEGTVVVIGSDGDGSGSNPFEFDGPIELVKGTDYTLTIQMFNSFLDEDEEGYDVSEEVAAEDFEHQLFFRFSDGVFSSPSGTGNILEPNQSSGGGNINYIDFDGNQRPVGLETSWTTANTASSGKSFRIVLMHQPDGQKTDNSNSNTGEPDLDITIPLNITN